MEKVLSTTQSRIRTQYLIQQKLTAEKEEYVRILLFLAVHIPLAFLFQYSGLLSTAHALIVLVVGLIIALRDSNPYGSVLIAAYIVGAEIVWRGTGALVFWEFGKFSIIIILGISLLRHRSLTRAPKWALVYFIFLIPSIFVLPAFDREAISFNLSGPLALAISVMVLDGLVITKKMLKQILIAILAPVIGLGALALYSTLTAGLISFIESYAQKLTTAGIGPNQASSILGLGALVAFFFLLNDTRGNFHRTLFAGISLWLFAQTALTFSRGGFWTAIISVLVAGYYLIQNRRYRSIFFSATAGLVVIGFFVVFPILDQLTQGSIETRFSSADSTGRDNIAISDIDTFLENPFFGVGPNQSKDIHLETLGKRSNAHVEYTRLLAEHGIFGLFAMLLLFLESGKRLLTKMPPQRKAYVVSFTVWALLFMFHSATRLAAPSLLFALGSAAYMIDDAPLRNTVRKLGPSS